MPKQLRLFCFTPGIPGSNVFTVVIDDNQTIGELKGEIKEHQGLARDVFTADELLLYKINAHGSTVKERNEALEEEIRRVEATRKANNDRGLDPLGVIGEVFQNNPPLQRRFTYSSSLLQVSQYIHFRFMTSTCPCH